MLRYDLNDIEAIVFYYSGETIIIVNNKIDENKVIKKVDDFVRDNPDCKFHVFA